MCYLGRGGEPARAGSEADERDGAAGKLHHAWAGGGSAVCWSITVERSESCAREQWVASRGSGATLPGVIECAAEAGAAASDSVRNAMREPAVPEKPLPGALASTAMVSSSAASVAIAEATPRVALPCSAPRWHALRSAWAAVRDRKVWWAVWGKHVKYARGWLLRQVILLA